MKQGDENNDSTHEDDLYESDDGDTFTLNALVRTKVHGGDVEKDDDDFIVKETRYTRVDDEREP